MSAFATALTRFWPNGDEKIPGLRAGVIASAPGGIRALRHHVAGSIRSRRVIDTLARLVSERGAPSILRSDNGPEFVSLALLKWITDEGIRTGLIEPCKPWQNGTCESFNGKFRDECLSVEWFRSREEARVLRAGFGRASRAVRSEARASSRAGHGRRKSIDQTVEFSRPRRACLAPRADTNSMPGPEFA